MHYRDSYDRIYGQSTGRPAGRSVARLPCCFQTRIRARKLARREKGELPLAAALAAVMSLALSYLGFEKKKRERKIHFVDKQVSIRGRARCNTNTESYRRQVMARLNRSGNIGDARLRLEWMNFRNAYVINIRWLYQDFFNSDRMVFKTRAAIRTRHIFLIRSLIRERSH